MLPSRGIRHLQNAVKSLSPRVLGMANNPTASNSITCNSCRMKSNLLYTSVHHNDQLLSKTTLHQPLIVPVRFKKGMDRGGKKTDKKKGKGTHFVFNTYIFNDNTFKDCRYSFMKNFPIIDFIQTLCMSRT